MRYASGSWHLPYAGEPSPQSEALGFGEGGGTVEGEVAGSLRWANYPRRRQDGVWTPNLRGVLTTGDGAEILVSIHGQSVLEEAPGTRRAILARLELTTQADPYRWLNTCFVVGEGEIDGGTDEWWITAYVVVNEVAAGPPALGAPPPPRFAQKGG